MKLSRKNRIILFQAYRVLRYISGAAAAIITCMGFGLVQHDRVLLGIFVLSLALVLVIMLSETYLGKRTPDGVKIRRVK